MDVNEVREQVDRVFNEPYDPTSYPVERQAAVDEYIRMFGSRETANFERWLNQYYNADPLENFIARVAARRAQKVIEAAQQIVDMAGEPPLAPNWATVRLQAALDTYHGRGGETPNP